MSRQRLITLFLVAVSLALLAHFLLIWIFGKYTVYENNKVILSMETLFVFGVFGTGLVEFIRFSTRTKQLNQKILALEQVADSTDIKIVEANGEFWKLNWQFALRNHSVHSLRFDVLVKYFDTDGSIIHNDFASNLWVAPNSRSVFSDCTLVPSAIATSIAHARVEIMQRTSRNKSNSASLNEHAGFHDTVKSTQVALPPPKSPSLRYFQSG
jgi:hypothetical protein